MGAQEFYEESCGKTAEEAFRKVVDEAAYECGHGGYTGSVAEKHSFVMIPLPEGKDAMDYANELIENEDSRIDDKWGPAGCLKLEDDKFLFFGWASS